MASKKEEERNEKIIRGLMKLPPNRRCINCNSLGPQYVCTNFWTFICTTCSGIHREFTHRVKSISMAKFTSQEVDALQRGGNQRAREIFLKEWDTQRRKLPDSSNVDRVREFIKDVYMDRKYAAAKSSDKPPRDMQSSKNHEEDYRRASSYHSFSQSPPYEHQYEDRRYGKPPGALTRKGSDRGQYDGRFSGFAYSPGHLGGQIMFEDRFANDDSGSRVSDYSASSTSDPFRDVQSPNFQKDVEFGSSPVQPVRDVLGETLQPQTKKDVDAITRPQRIASSGSFGSFESNSLSLKSFNSGGFIDTGLGLEPTAGARSSVSVAAGQEPFHASFIQPSATSLAAPINLFADASHFQPSIASFKEKASAISASTAIQGSFPGPFMQPLATSSAPSIDLFADATHLQPSIASLDQQPPPVSIPDEGWATFDLPHHVAPTPSPQTNYVSPALVTSGDGLAQGNFEVLSSVNNSLQWPSMQNPTNHGPLSPTSIQWPGLAYEAQAPIGLTSSQLWNAFGDSHGSFPQASSENILPKNEYLGETPRPPAFSNQDKNTRILEEPRKDGFQRSIVEDLVAVPTLPVNGVVNGSLFPLPELALMGGLPSNAHDRKSTNPFDFPDDSEVESCSMFLNMGSLQAALPNPPMPAFPSSLNTSWFPQNPAPPFMPAVPQGGLAYMGGQGPTSQLPNLASQGSVVPLGGNPFA